MLFTHPPTYLPIPAYSTTYLPTCLPVSLAIPKSCRFDWNQRRSKQSNWYTRRVNYGETWAWERERERERRYLRQKQEWFQEKPPRVSRWVRPIRGKLMWSMTPFEPSIEWRTAAHQSLLITVTSFARVTDSQLQWLHAIQIAHGRSLFRLV